VRIKLINIEKYFVYYFLEFFFVLSYEYKKKKATKVSIIADNSKNVLGVHIPFNSNRYDVKLVTSIINNIKLKFNNAQKINLIGDKGYISQEKYKNNNQEVKIITPHRKYKKKVKINVKYKRKIQNMNINY